MTESPPPGTDEFDSRLSALREDTDLSPDDRAEYADLLLAGADAAGEHGELTTEAEYLDELRDLADRTEDPEVTRALAEALANATDVVDRDEAFTEACPAKRHERLLEEVRTLAEETDDEAVTVAYMRTLKHMVSFEGKEEAFERASEYLSELESLYDGESQARAEQLAGGLMADALRHARSNDRGGPGKAGREHTVLERHRRLYEDHPTDGVAAELAHSLCIVSVTHGLRDRYQSQTDTIEELETLYEDHPTDAVANRVVWAMAIAAGETGDNSNTDAVQDLAERARAYYEDHQVPEVATSMAKCYQEMADVYFGGRPRFRKGEEVLEKLEGLYEEHPDLLASKLATQLAVAGAAYLENNRLSASERKREAIEALSDDHPEDDGVTAAFSDILGDQLDHHIDAANVAEARALWNHPELDEPVDVPGDVDDEELLEGAILVENTFEDDEQEFAEAEETRPWGGFPVVESPTVAFLLTVPVMGLYALLDPSLWVVTNWYPMGGSWDLLEVGGVLLLAAVALYYVYRIGSQVPPFSMFFSAGPLRFALVPTLLEDRDGSTPLTETDALMVLTAFTLPVLAFVDQTLMVYAVYGVVVWLVMVVALLFLATRFVAAGLASVSVTSRTEPELLERLDMTPREAEELVLDMFEHVA
jgi:hypothetical protein